MIHTQPHYKHIHLESIDALRQIFPSGKADTMNWVFLSTSGVHGHYATVDDLEHDEGYRNDDGTLGITVLVVHPRIVCCRYGTIEVTEKDFPFLRGLVASTLEAIALSQDGNLPVKEETDQE